jgi:glycosyltransferase involved in cell wall biosynthesis
MDSNDSKNPQIADICLILEGTYPYVTGGVSSWTHQLITNLPEFTFHLHCLIAEKEPGPWLFPRPNNVIGVSNLSLGQWSSENEEPQEPLDDNEEHELLGVIESFHRDLLSGSPEAFERLFGIFYRMGLSSKLFTTLSSGREAWNLIQKFYKEQFSQESFIDFFWMWRTTHLPLFSLLASPVPKARLYHSLASGYAGILGVMGKLAYERPLILTEHGLYTRERKIEIALAQWIGSGNARDDMTIRPINTSVKGFWMRIFEQLGRIVYHYSDHIITLFEGNRRIQIRDGAPAEKTKVIPNGIRVFSETKIREVQKAQSEKLSVAMIGRVVPIKDIKTFIQACRIVRDQLPEVQFLIMGPMNQDPEYVKECQNLVEILKMGDAIQFTGSVRVEDYLPKMDLLVLTSLSEAQPLVVMEGAIFGVPSVTTRVGACNELINGRTREDVALGPGGIVTSVGNPEETALAMLKILKDDGLRKRMGYAARLRMERFYREDLLFEAYRTLYQEGIG